MKIAVICGGLSNERDVSLSSGTGIARALRGQGHRVLLADLFLGMEHVPEDLDTLFTDHAAEADAAVADTAPDLAAVRAMRPGQGPVGPHVLDICQAADIVFLALHGEEGENGKLQAWFDISGVRYTGSGYLGSALAMNKAIAKTILTQAGVPLAEGIVLRQGEKKPAPGYPCVVKPCSGGRAPPSCARRRNTTRRGRWPSGMRTACWWRGSSPAES